MKDTIKFLQPYKGKTVEEVIAILQKKEQKINNEQSLAQQKKMEWYKGCIGKYYKIQHNNTTYTLVYIKEGQKHKSIDQYIYQNIPYQFLSWRCYTIILSDQPRIVSNAGFDVLWLGNPFEENKPQFTCKEITKEEFEEITFPFDSLIDKAKQILKTK
jgi:hypothetical protein